jgi:hypothetical protein
MDAREQLLGSDRGIDDHKHLQAPSRLLANPKLVDEWTPDGVVLVVADAAGDEVGFVGGDGRQPDREVC